MFRLPLSFFTIWPLLYAINYICICNAGGRGSVDMGGWGEVTGLTGGGIVIKKALRGKAK